MIYHLRTTFATAKRILQQLAHDHRTIALMLIAPGMLMTILWWVFSEFDEIFNMIAPALLGVFPFTILFLVTSITTLRERTGGTLERLMATPIGKLDVILGYAIAFSLFGILQSVITSVYAILVLGLEVPGSLWFVIFVAVLDTLLGVALGLMVSAFATTEFQAVQFMPVLIFPQILVCGLLVPLSQLPDVLEHIAYYLPLTYAVDALNLATQNSDITAEMWRDVWVVGAFIVGALGLASLTLRRRS
ncbi:MAG: ABC transporter permease [Microbacteriaceae bacterium]|nr:ABC transporter permease [Microbacteriaceae bacterium]